LVYVPVDARRLRVATSAYLGNGKTLADPPIVSRDHASAASARRVEAA